MSSGGSGSGRRTRTSISGCWTPWTRPPSRTRSHGAAWTRPRQVARDDRAATVRDAGTLAPHVDRAQLGRSRRARSRTAWRSSRRLTDAAAAAARGGRAGPGDCRGARARRPARAGAGRRFGVRRRARPGHPAAGRPRAGAFAERVTGRGSPSSCSWSSRIDGRARSRAGPAGDRRRSASSSAWSSSSLNRLPGSPPGTLTAGPALRRPARGAAAGSPRAGVRSCPRTTDRRSVARRSRP